MKRTIASLMVAAVTCTSVSALGQVNLYLVRVGGLDSLSTAQIDPDGAGPLPLAPNPNNAFWIGHNPAAIAYGKGNLYVAGIVNGTAFPLDGDDADGDTITNEPTPFNVSAVLWGAS